MNRIARSRTLARADAGPGDGGLGGPSRRIRLLGALTGAGLVLAGLGAYAVAERSAGGGARRPKAAAAAPVPPRVSTAQLAERNGVRIVHVAISGDGGLVDLRYQVLDPDKANAVHATSPELVDETTGAVVDQLFM